MGKRPVFRTSAGSSAKFPNVDIERALEGPYRFGCGGHTDAAAWIPPPLLLPS